MYKKLVDAAFEPLYRFTELEASISNGAHTPAIERKNSIYCSADEFLYAILELSVFYEARSPALSASLKSIYEVGTHYRNSSRLRVIAKSFFETKRSKENELNRYIELVVRAIILFTNEIERFSTFNSCDYYFEYDNKRIDDVLETLQKHEHDVRFKFVNREKYDEYERT